MGQADAREVADVVYMLANESGKQRASRNGTARARQSWRTVFLSTGETTLSQKMGEAGKRTMAGLDARLANLPADAGAGYGVFQALHGRAEPAELADELRSAALAHHGVAAIFFLYKLTRERAETPASLRSRLEVTRNLFLTEYLPELSTGQVQRVADRFALIAAAGELARNYEVLPWPDGEATRAAGACFLAWMADRGGYGPAEDAAALAQVRLFFETHGESRFTSFPDSGGSMADTPRTINRAGFRRRVGNGDGDSERWEYLVLPETPRAARKPRGDAAR